MAHVIDARNGGGEIVLLGTSLALPASPSSITPVVGSLRYNPSGELIEFYSSVGGNSPVWSAMVSASYVAANYLPLSGGSLSGNLVVQGTLTCSNIVGTTTAAFYAADLAERYAADAAYEPGTVLVIGGSAEVTISTISGDPKLAGIVSTCPAFIMNYGSGTDDTHPLVALKGRVPCKVVGLVSQGDLLTTSDIPGHAMTAPFGTPDAAIIGKALAGSATETGIVEVKV